MTQATPKKRGRPSKSTLSTKDSAKKKSTNLSQPNTAAGVGHPWADADTIRRYGKAELIRKYAVTFPKASPAEISAAMGEGFPKPYVVQVLWHWKQKQKGVKVVKRLDEVLMDTPDPKMPKFIPKHDPVNHPAHYTAGGIETIDFIEAKQLPYNLGNVIKYITRADLKGAKIEDLHKARWYLDREITRVTPPLA